MTLRHVITGFGLPPAVQGDRRQHDARGFDPKRHDRDGDGRGAADDAPGHGARPPGKGGTPPGHAKRADHGNGLGLQAGVQLGPGPALGVGLNVAPLLGLNLQLDLGLGGDHRANGEGLRNPQAAQARADGHPRQAPNPDRGPNAPLPPVDAAIGEHAAPAARAGLGEPARVQGGPAQQGPGHQGLGQQGLGQQGPAALALGAGTPARDGFAREGFARDGFARDGFATGDRHMEAGRPVAEIAANAAAGNAGAEVTLNVVLPVQDRITAQALAMDRLAEQTNGAVRPESPIRTVPTPNAPTAENPAEAAPLAPSAQVPRAAIETPSVQTALARDAVAPTSADGVSGRAADDLVSASTIAPAPGERTAAFASLPRSEPAATDRSAAAASPSGSEASPADRSTAATSLPRSEAPPATAPVQQVASATGRSDAPTTEASPVLRPQNAGFAPEPGMGASLANATSTAAPSSAAAVGSASGPASALGSQATSATPVATNAAVSTSPGASGLGGAPLPLFNPFLARRLGRGPRSRRADPSARGNGLWSILRVLGWRRRRRALPREDRPGMETDERSSSPSLATVRKWVRDRLRRHRSQPDDGR